MDILTKLKLQLYNTDNKQVQDALTDAHAEITQLRAELTEERELADALHTALSRAVKHYRDGHCDMALSMYATRRNK